MSYIAPPNRNLNRQIEITLKDGTVSLFSPFNFKFIDSIKPEFQSYEAFGRMDPVMIYKKTSRDASLSFKVVSESEDESLENFGTLMNLITGMYPIYEETIGTEQTSDAAAQNQITNGTSNSLQNTFIKVAPLISIKFMNLLNDSNFIAAVTNFKYDLDFENGSSTYVKNDGKAFPGIYTVDLSFKILHTYLPGTKLLYTNK